jgi:hypothetical protein
MIRIEGRGAVYGEVWFDEDPPATRDVDILLHFQRQAPLGRGRCTPFLSLVTDLCPAPAAIMEGFGKDCRYKIRRADSRDELRMEFVAEPQGRLDEFCRFYDTFARRKTLPAADRRWLTAACKAGQLALTLASRNGEALVWHAYVVSGRTARLQYTGSCFRDRENDFRALVGRANRWLHWRDMLCFKERGMQHYDWGGLFEDESVPEHAGVNGFKKDFGGQPVRSYDCTVPVTARGRIWMSLRTAWHCRHTVRELGQSFSRRLFTS